MQMSLFSKFWIFFCFTIFFSVIYYQRIALTIRLLGFKHSNGFGLINTSNFSGV